MSDAETIADFETSFDLRWKADMRAIERWQAATGRTLVWPDHADLCVWLLERLDAAEKAMQDMIGVGERADAKVESDAKVIAALREALDETLHLFDRLEYPDPHTSKRIREKYSIDEQTAGEKS